VLLLGQHMMQLIAGCAHGSAAAAVQHGARDAWR
jgi:hypothetical protein